MAMRVMFICRALINSCSDLKATDPHDQIRLQKTLEKVGQTLLFVGWVLS